MIMVFLGEGETREPTNELYAYLTENPTKCDRKDYDC